MMFGCFRDDSRETDIAPKKKPPRHDAKYIKFLTVSSIRVPACPFY